MKNLFKYLSGIGLTVGILTIIVFAGAVGKVQAQSGTICGMPGNCTPVYKFKARDLPFSTGRQAKFKSGDFAESNEFYAVVLNSMPIGFSEGDTCLDFSETKRLAAQKLFPKNKVFASHYCGDTTPTLIYKSYVDWHDRTFLAVFLGETNPDGLPAISEKDAAAFLVKAKKNFPKAELRKMTVTIDYTNK